VAWSISAPIEQAGGGGAPSKVVRGGAHPSGGAAWKQWRMLRAAASNGGEAASVMDVSVGVAQQCRGRREKVRVSKFGWRESAWSCSSMMADGGGARARTREEEGSLVAGASKTGS
jgi:hypothetical protein